MHSTARTPNSPAGELEPIIVPSDASSPGNDAPERPGTSSRVLEERVTWLTKELVEARSAHREQLVEKERLARHLALVLHALPAGVVVIDGDGWVRECNPAAAELLGENLHGALWRDVVQRVIAPRADDAHDVSLSNGRRVNITTCSLGAEPGQILLIQDVTETRELQDQLTHLERLSQMGKMVASLAHQIRTPLASALLYASNLRGRQTAADERWFIQEKLVERLRSLEQLVTDMLTFARQGNFAVEEIVVGELLDDYVGSLGAHLASHGVKLSFRSTVPTARIHGNPEALKSTLQNLVNNALQAGGDGLTLRLEAQAPTADVVRITLADDGPGIPPSLQERVFDPFYTSRPDGTGLGLAIVRGIIGAHRGTVRLESTPGEGSAFSIDLPLVRPEIQPSG